jgi:hypothetical protein
LLHGAERNPRIGDGTERMPFAVGWKCLFYREFLILDRWVWGF